MPRSPPVHTCIVSIFSTIVVFLYLWQQTQVHAAILTAEGRLVGTEQKEGSQLLVLGTGASGTSVVMKMMLDMNFWGGDVRDFKNPEKGKFFGERIDVEQNANSFLNGLGYPQGRYANISAIYTPSSVPEMVYQEAEPSLAELIKIYERRGENFPDLKLLARFTTSTARIMNTMNKHRPWVIKSPRLSLLLPMLEPHLDSPMCLFVFRDPAKVTSSRIGWTHHRASSDWNFCQLW